ncbi:uncharacterized protein N0V89_004994 [Didymosphaeria variabile]|uniref:Uncharacterized protein n=1 Tax=Didymosphaeria variabile TaxID=1932322 RepID=A0A9W8XMN3_9PLEO|nr:uncharacterized protein N0V89_004994 [Didymosphaeria variabile]KAJ4353267.1 hypothetical protein N0V89_004994 [Didymosphaeria variabile]
MDNSALLAQDGNEPHNNTAHDIQTNIEPPRRTSSAHSPLSQPHRPNPPSSAATTAFDRPYDPPEIRTHDTDSDIALQQLDEPLHQGYTESPIQYKDDYGYLGAGHGSTFDSDTRSLLSAKHYDHHESRKFLLKTGAYRFMITLGFSVAIGLCLKAYEGFREPLIMSKIQVRYFNAIMLGLSLGLGLNLASSLKRYAVILRWYLLARRYVSLEVFDLILGLETLTKVGKLMIISLPGIRKVKFLSKLPWFREAIANLQTWSLYTGDEGWSPNITSMESASSAGTEASVYPEFALNAESQTDLSSLPGTPLYHDNGTNVYEYRFYNRNPAHQFQNYIVSGRKIRATASCKMLDIQGTPQWTDNGNDTDYQYIMGKEDGKDWDMYWLPEYTNGGCLNWIGSTWEGCGPRCTNLTIYQEATSDNSNISKSSLFLCNSTVSEVEGDSPEFQNLSDEDKKHLHGTDEFARIAAGSIAWTGWFPADYSDRQIRSYLRGSKWSPNKTVTAGDVEELLARYTIGSIAAFDDHGLRYEVANQNAVPTQGQQLNVDWPYILGLLGGICLIQFAALICLLAFGNKSVVRDESFMSMAMLLKPVMDRIPGKTGMNMSGEEIKNHPKLLWKRIRYDYREGKTGEPNQVDIFFQGRDDAESRRSWAPGVYS